MGQGLVANEAQLDYLQRTGDRTITQTNYTENEHGFASYKIENDTLQVIQVYGDGSYWYDFFEKLAKNHKCARVIFYTRRNPKAFERKYGMKVVQTLMMKELPNG